MTTLLTDHFLFSYRRFRRAQWPLLFPFRWPECSLTNTSFLSDDQSALWPLLSFRWPWCPLTTVRSLVIPINSVVVVSAAANVYISPMDRLTSTQPDTQKQPQTQIHTRRRALTGWTGVCTVVWPLGGFESGPSHLQFISKPWIMAVRLLALVLFALQEEKTPQIPIPNVTEHLWTLDRPSVLAVQKELGDGV